MSAREQGLGAPALPQVNLLPPEVRVARTVSRVKQWMGVSIVIALLAVAAAYFLAADDLSTAQRERETSQRGTDQLLAEKQNYREVPVVLAALEDAQSARFLGFSAEVLWADYLGAIEAVLSPGMSIDTASVAVVTTADVEIPFEERAWYTLTFAGRSTTVADIPDWIDGLDALPGLSGARMDVASITGDDAVSYYEVTTSVRVTSGAMASRFIAVLEDAEDASTADTSGEG